MIKHLISVELDFHLAQRLISKRWRKNDRKELLLSIVEALEVDDVEEDGTET